MFLLDSKREARVSDGAIVLCRSSRNSSTDVLVRHQGCVSLDQLIKLSTNWIVGLNLGEGVMKLETLEVVFLLIGFAYIGFIIAVSI